MANEVQDFWKMFLKKYWHRRPVVFKDLLPKTVFTDHEILNAIAQSGRRMKVYVAGNEFMGAQDHLAPKRQERNLEAYLRRLEREFAPNDFALTIVNFNADLGMERFRQFRALMDDFYSAVGVPYGTSGSNLNLFLGNYRKTPVGMHKDAESTFVMPIYGRKKMRVWPGKVFDRILPADGFLFEYGKYLSRSILLSGKPGDVLFWPSSYWHVGEGDKDGKIFASLHFSFNDAGNLGSWSRGKLSAKLFDSLYDSTFPNQSLNSDAMDFFAHRIAKTLGKHAANHQLKEYAERELLRFQSALGFNLLPKLPDLVSMPLYSWKDCTLRLTGSQDVIARSFKKGSIELFACGHSQVFKSSASAEVMKFVKKLNRHRSLSLAELEKMSPKAQRVARRMILFLLQTSAVVEREARTASLRS